MTLYVTEQEMIDRFIDSLKRAADRAKDFPETPMNKKGEKFVEFINDIKVAAGSAHQLGHAQENPKWLDTRDLLENIITVGYTLPQNSENENGLWAKVQTLLEQLSETGRKLATMRAMKRVDVLTHLDARSKKNLN